MRRDVARARPESSRLRRERGRKRAWAGVHPAAAARLANKRKNKNAWRGAQSGLTSVAHGISSGVYGIVEKPMQGGASASWYGPLGSVSAADLRASFDGDLWDLVLPQPPPRAPRAF